LKILQVNYYDDLGGAARIAWLLHQGYRSLGHQSWMAAGVKLSSDPFVEQITLPPSESFLGLPLIKLAEYADKQSWKIGNRNFSGLLRRIAQPSRYLKRNQGFEDFDFPGSRLITSLPEEIPEIVHLHNLHLNYFDLTYLPELSQRFPTVMTLHDMWPLTGHCAHAMDCPRWITGCGECPQLDVYPAMNHDQTAYNWQRKKDIYAKSKLYLTGPSKWMVQTAQSSILAPAIVKARVIPNGIDLTVFRAGDKQEARELLGLPKDAAILLFVSASGIQHSSFKDYSTIQKAIEIVALKAIDRRILFIALGDTEFTEMIEDVEVRYLPHIDSTERLAKYYQAVDIYLHASKAESFGLVIAEAQACGTPVIATSIGGIPDTIKDGESGFLTKPNDAQDMADKIVLMLSSETMIESMGKNGTNFAQNNFGVEQMIQNYMKFYQEILDDRNV